MNQNFAFAAIYNVAAISLAMLGLVPRYWPPMMAESSLARTMSALRFAAGKAK